MLKTTCGNLHATIYELALVDINYLEKFWCLKSTQLALGAKNVSVRIMFRLRLCTQSYTELDAINYSESFRQ